MKRVSVITNERRLSVVTETFKRDYMNDKRDYTDE